MYIAILGRQPSFGIAELERLYGAAAVAWFSDQTATISNSKFNFDRLGGSQKAGRIISTLDRGDWREVHNFITQHYYQLWKTQRHKITLGISVYGLTTPANIIQRTGIELKKQLRHHDVSLRLIPNRLPALNTATSHHNKLGLSPNKVELLIVRGASGQIHIAESVGAQNISAIAARDQARPKTDAFVGMLPPKLARMMVNLAVGQIDGPDATSSEQTSDRLTILDPFCGTGVVLQEALLLGYDAYGSDLSEKMVEYSRINLDWLTSKFPRLDKRSRVEIGDAIQHTWLDSQSIGAVVSETYLGQPFSAPPTTSKLAEVRDNCNHIVKRFLTNIATQLPPGTPVVIAVPAWRDSQGHITHLPLVTQLDKLGYQLLPLKQVRHDQLIYYRQNQVVARQLLLLKNIRTEVAY